ncbi:hypothetical protein ACF0H5_005850 [Mactra antiquata]
MADTSTEKVDNAAAQQKVALKQDNVPKQNGVGEDDVPVNGISDDNLDNAETMETNIPAKDSIKPSTNGDSDNNVEGSPLSKKDESAEEVNSITDDTEKCDEKMNGSVHSGDESNQNEKNALEAIEIDSKDDDDSSVVEISSNISQPSQEEIEIKENDSANPSVISEETSRDSIDSNSNTSVKSKDGSESNAKDGVVSTVKVDGGDEILITLNEDEECDGKEVNDENNDDDDDDDDKDKDGDEEKKDLSVEKSDKSDSESKETKNENDKASVMEEGKKQEESDAKTETKTTSSVANVSVAPASITTAAKAAPILTQAPMTSILIPTTGVTFPIFTSQNVLISGAAPGAQIVKQGNQLGYITMSGNQRLFVPVTGVQLQGAASPMIASQLATGVQQQQQQQPAQTAKTPTPEELRPKSSMETIELMKWEVQNRIADNYNWSVAFHPRKEELSSVTSFLQELGSDVVKEQVYKDIIQIQTKKKENGDLKDAEIESLEKMKTVYENTRKKVEHLQLDTKECEQCSFRTESSVVMNFHHDFPHYDPPWDLSKGTMECSHCSFRTKVAAQYIFHMKDIHSTQAKFMEKSPPFQCSLCPLNAATKNKLEKHQLKCTKNFKLNSNLHPYYHDVNFCMKTCYYKPKKPAPPPKPAPKPPAPVVSTRQQAGTLPSQQAANQQQIRPSSIVPKYRPVVRPAVAAAQVVQRPGINVPQRPRIPMPTLQRAPAQQQQQKSKPPGKEMAGFEVCELCGGYVKDRQALRIHFFYAHKVEMPQAIFNRPNAPLTCEVCKEHFWTTQGLTKHKTARRHFSNPVSQAAPQNTTKFTVEQECFMCLKKYPNLFVHFERVHGMTMKDLIMVRKCIVCGASTNDYKSLENHLVQAHGMMIRLTDYISDKNKPVAKPSATPIISGGKNVGKINYCVFCQIQFADNIQLTMHCIQIHATCETCGMVVSTSKHLTGHSCRSAHINKSCYICGTKVASQEKYAIHLRSHVTPCKVVLKNLDQNEIDSIKDKIKREYKPAIISLDSDEDSDVEVVESKSGKGKVESEKDVVEIDGEPKDKKVKESNDNEPKSELKESTETDKNEDVEITDKKTAEAEKDSESEKPVDNDVEKTNDKDVKMKEEPLKNEDSESNETEIVAPESSKKQEEEKISETALVKNETVSNEPELETANKEEAAIDEDELLKSDENSNSSSGDRKRKLSESSINEDDILKDDDDESSGNKRLKLEESNDNEAKDNTYKEKNNEKNEEMDCVDESS